MPVFDDGAGTAGLHRRTAAVRAIEGALRLWPPSAISIPPGACRLLRAARQVVSDLGCDVWAAVLSPAGWGVGAATVSVDEPVMAKHVGGASVGGSTLIPSAR